MLFGCGDGDGTAWAQVLDRAGCRRARAVSPRATPGGAPVAELARCVRPECEDVAGGGERDAVAVGGGDGGDNDPMKTPSYPPRRRLRVGGAITQPSVSVAAPRKQFPGLSGGESVVLARRDGHNIAPGAGPEPPDYSW